MSEEKLEQYANLLMSFVGKIRLTGAQTEDAIRAHIDDCRAAWESLTSPPRPLSLKGEGEQDSSCGKKIIDVGTGGGLPGIVWAILCRDAGHEFTLLDSIGKKCRAVEQMRRELGLENVKVVCERAEIYARRPVVFESYDIAVARAVTAMPQLASWLAPFVKFGGYALAFKGPKFGEETAGMDENSWKKLGFAPPEVMKYHPDRENVLVRLKKI